jgi:hypothetical protein
MARFALLVAAAFCAALMPAQTVLSPILDATPPGDPDNQSRLYVLQPSRLTGAVYYMPLFTGNTGALAMPVVSFSGRYGFDNSGLSSTFCSLDTDLHLWFPNPILNTALWWLPMVGPLQSGVLTPFTPPVLVSGPGNLEMAIYFQLAGVEVASVAPLALNFGFSAGVTCVQTEGLGQLVPPGLTPAGARRGTTLATGDLNGDGVDDLVIGAPNEMVMGVAGAGRIYIHLGVQRTASNPGGLHPVPYTIREPAIGALQIIANPGPELQAHFGAALAIGNLDADAPHELVVAAPESDGYVGEPDQGEVFVFRNLHTLLQGPLPTSPTELIVPVADITPVQPFIERAYARYGYDLAVGDVDGDGQKDVVASAPNFRVSQLAPAETGAVYIFRGPVGPVFQSQNEDWMLTDAAPQSYAHFGSALTLADLDADQKKEIVVASPGATIAGSGAAGKLEAFRVDPSGPVSVLVRANPTPVAGAGLGVSIASGDLTGDGRDDLVCGTEESVSGFSAAGRVHVWRMEANYATTHETFSSDAPASYGRYGRTVLVRDMNNDGLNDVVVGVPGQTTSGLAWAGAVRVHFGAPQAQVQLPYRDLHLRSNQPAGYALFGAALAAGDFAGVGVPDLIVGEPLGASLSLPGSGKVHCFTDLLHAKDNVTLPSLAAGQTPAQ